VLSHPLTQITTRACAHAHASTRGAPTCPAASMPTDFRHSHLVIILYNMILAELCVFVIIDEGIKWLLLIFYQFLFRWAMAEPEIQTLELQDEKGWHLLFRQTAPFVWPKGHINLCEVRAMLANFGAPLLRVAQR
jgi:hypothetical protein